ncbi:MAG: HAMP domain-containing histidine kinase, partial [Campylobacterales bacterium]|nr:HAMP domain-containing histidine kinase [Campylobacterales bacterium]
LLIGSYLILSNGILYQLDIGVNLELITLLTWVVGDTGILFLIIFSYVFFEVRKKYKKLKTFFYGVMAINGTLISIVIFAVLFDNSLFYITKITQPFYKSTLVLIILFGIYMYMKKEAGAKVYIAGQGILLTSTVLYLLGLSGSIEDRKIVSYLPFFGILIDISLLTLIQYEKTKKEIEDLKKNKELLLEQSRFYSIGQAIGHITHQWKQPLTNIGTSITLFEAILHHKTDELIPTVKSKLPSLNSDIAFMKNTMDEFSEFYGKDIEKKEFFLKETINNIKKILSSKVTLSKAQIDLKTDLEKIYGYEHIFSNIVLIMINNSLDEFISSPNSNNKISIFIEKKNSEIILHYRDNGGGIKISPVEKAFEYFVSTKKGGSNQGMGLPILKMLVEEKLKGSITVENRDRGVFFQILFSI